MDTENEVKQYRVGSASMACWPR